MKKVNIHHIIRVIVIILFYNNLIVFNSFSQEHNKPSFSSIDPALHKNPNSAFLKIKKSLKNALAKGDSIAAALSYEQIAELFYYQGAYPQAAAYYYKANKIFRKQNDLVNLAKNLHKLGETYYYGRQYPVSRAQFQEALGIYRKAGDGKGIARSYGLIGQTYEKTGDSQNAMKYQLLALSVYKKEKDQTGIAKIYENLGSVYEDKFKLDSALKYFDLALAGNKITGDSHAQIEIINNIGDVYRKKGEYEKALPYTKEAGKLSKQMNDQYQLSSAYRDLSKNFDLIKRYDSAYYYSELGRSIFLKIFTEDNNKQLALLQTLFEIQQKDDAIVRFENEKEANQITIIASVLIIILLISLAASTISRQRLKLRNEQKINEQNKVLYVTQKNAIEGELELKSKELTSNTLLVIQNNQFLEMLRAEIADMVKDDKRDHKKQMQQLIQRINQSISHDQHWKEFTGMFEQIHQTFFDSLKKHCDDLTANDIRLISLIKMNLSSKDMAALFGISQDSLRVARYRLRKKLDIPQGENLSSFIQAL